jgi:hypothetical protein
MDPCLGPAKAPSLSAYMVRDVLHCARCFLEQVRWGWGAWAGRGGGEGRLQGGVHGTKAHRNGHSGRHQRPLPRHPFCCPPRSLIAYRGGGRPNHPFLLSFSMLDCVSGVGRATHSVCFPSRSLIAYRAWEELITQRRTR